MKNKHILFKFIRLTFKTYKSYYFITIISCLILSFETIFNAYSLSILISYLEKNVYKDALKVGAVLVLINFIFYFLNKFLNKKKLIILF